MSHGAETADRCFKHKAETSPSLIQNGKLVLQPYHVGFIISGSLGLVAIITSFWLISKHLQWYTNKREQRYIVRILFMVPLYALISFLSFLFWNHSTPLILIRDAYEALVLTAFFYLLLMYLSHDPEEQKRIFVKYGLSREADAIALKKGQDVTKWVLPLGFVKWKPKDGLYFLQLMKWGVLQYCVVRPTSTFAAVILDYIGLYCESSWGLGWGHVYITILMSISVTIAMYCLIQLYVPVAKELAPHKPLLKLFSIKAVVFLTFWQATFLSVLSMFGIVKDTKYMTAEDINIGIGAVAECFEMMLFGFIHIIAFSYKPYSAAGPTGDMPDQTHRWRSLAHALDFRETFREIWVGCVYMLDRLRGREPTPDFGVIREGHYEGAFGRSRRGGVRAQSVKKPGVFSNSSSSSTTSPSSSADQKKYTLDDVTYPTVAIGVEEKVEVDVDGRRQWLMTGLERDRRRPGLHPGREKSETLQEQFDKEMEKLGYPSGGARKSNHDPKEDMLHPAGRRQRSWWRSMYARISQSGPDIEEEERTVQRTRHRSPSHGRRWRHSERRQSRNLEGSDDVQLNRVEEHDIDDQPPPSRLLTRGPMSNTKIRRVPVPLTLDTVDDTVPLPLRSSDLSRYSVAASPPAPLPPPPAGPPSSGNYNYLPPGAAVPQRQRQPYSVNPLHSPTHRNDYYYSTSPYSYPVSDSRHTRQSAAAPLIFSASPESSGQRSGPSAPSIPSSPVSPSRTGTRTSTSTSMSTSPQRTGRRPTVVPIMPQPLAPAAETEAEVEEARPLSAHQHPHQLPPPPHDYDHHAQRDLPQLGISPDTTYDATRHLTTHERTIRR